MASNDLSKLVGLSIWNMEHDIMYAFVQNVRRGYAISAKRSEKDFALLVKKGVFTSKKSDSSITYRLTDLGREWLIKQLSYYLEKPVSESNLFASIDEFSKMQFIRRMERAQLHGEIDKLAPQWNALNQREREALLQLSFTDKGEKYYREADKLADEYRALRRYKLVDMDADSSGYAYWQLTQTGRDLLLALPDGTDDRLYITRAKLNPQPPAPPPVDPDYPLSASEYIAKYNLPRGSFDALRDVIKCKTTSFGSNYRTAYIFADIAPTDEQRTAILDRIKITKSEACKRFNVKPAQFDKAKRQYGLKHVDSGLTEERHVYYLYRLSDVQDALKKAGLIEP